MGLEVYWREQIEGDEKEKKERQEKKKKREREEREEYGDFVLGDDDPEDVEYPSSFENMGQVYFDARSDTSGIWTLLSKHSRTYQIRRKMKVIVMHTPEFFKRRECLSLLHRSGHGETDVLAFRSQPLRQQHRA